MLHPSEQPNSTVLVRLKWLIQNGLRHEKTCPRGFANNTGADQPVHRYSLNRASVICLLESIIRRLATSEISIFSLVSVAEETGFKLAL